MLRHRLKLPLGRPRLLAVLPLAGLLVGCQPPGQDVADRIAGLEGQLIGYPVGSLMACAGVPPRVASEGGREFMTFESAYRYQEVHPYADPFWPYGRYSWPGFAYAPRVIARDYQCEATVTVEGGIVTQASFRTPVSSRGNTAQCEAIFANCVFGG
ncbi:MAG: hypothetical protein RLO50_09940 [Azospirillaceae bacterium]